MPTGFFAFHQGSRIALLRLIGNGRRQKVHSRGKNNFCTVFAKKRNAARASSAESGGTVTVGAVLFAANLAGRIEERPRDMKRICLLVSSLLFAAALAASGADAKENYDKGCAKCHGADGKGKTKMGEKLGIRDLTDAKVQAELKDDAAFKAIKEGIKKDDKVLMKAAEGLSDDDIKALVKLVRGFKK